MIEDIDRRTLAMASAILVVTTTFGLLAVGPLGVILGPLIDHFLTPRILASREVQEPGRAAVVGGHRRRGDAAGAAVGQQLGGRPQLLRAARRSAPRSARSSSA